MLEAGGISPLAGRRIVLGVSAGIAAYKAVEICRRMVDAGAFVSPVLTEDALRFVGAVTFSALASEPARTSLHEGGETIPHTRLGQSADLIVIAPATANILAKQAAGIADDLLTATLLATRAPVLVAPAMHTEMWEHPSVQENLATLRRRGVFVCEPESGRLAGGDEGEGRLADPSRIIAAAEEILSRGQDLSGLRIVVTAGGTREAIDPVRFIGNRSSGKMGHAIAQVASTRGAAVTLITTSSIPVGAGIEVVSVTTAEEMRLAVDKRFSEASVVVMAAAVADFRPKVVASEKIKKHSGAPEIILEPTPDILSGLGQRKTHQILVGFAAETENLEEYARAKMEAKRVDIMVANDVSDPEAGFEVPTNRAILLDSMGSHTRTPLMSKMSLAEVILDRVAVRLGRANNRESQ